MVGIVVVSHSRKAAEGIRDVATEMGGDARVEAVGGTGDGRIGTSPEPISRAIADAADGNGVVVLVDLGSAVMNAEIAIEEAELEEEVVLADAPVMEGALNAAVAAGAPDATVDSVRMAAEDAQRVKKFG